MGPTEDGGRSRGHADGLLRPRRLEEVHRQVREAGEDLRCGLLDALGGPAERLAFSLECLRTQKLGRRATIARVLLTQAFEKEGIWTIPDVEIELRGVLSFDPTIGIRLRVFASSGRFGSLIQTSGPFAIAGHVSTTEVSLIDCYPVGQSIAEGISEATFLVSRVAFGCHVASLSELSCQGIRVSFTALDEWVAPIIPLLRILPSAVDRIGQFSVVLTQERNRFVANHGGASISLGFSTGWAETRSRASFDAHAQFEVTINPPITAEQAIERYVRPLEDFVTLATGKVNVVHELDFTRTHETDIPARHQVAIIYQPIQLKGTAAERLLHPRGLFSLIDVENTFAERVAGWLTAHEQYRTVCNLLFATLYNSRQYLESRFLAVLQAAEGYHRQRSDMRQVRTPVSEYRKLKKDIVCNCSTDARDTILRGLQYANEVSLRMRLAELNERFGSLIPGVLPSEDRDTIARDCAAARNAFAHHLPDQLLTDHRKLHAFAEFFVRVLAVGLMLDAGFSTEEVRHAMLLGASLSPEMRYGA